MTFTIDAHTCHARGCTRKVDPSLLMCARHWRLCPRPQRLEVLRWYRKGQEDSKTPSAQYLTAARAAIDAVYALEQARDVPRTPA